MSERFDILFERFSEESAIELLKTPPDKLSNPVDKYMAATRLAACNSDRSLQALIQATDLDPDNLFNRITRRKALEALGRRKNASALPFLFKALDFDDEPSVINAIDSIAQISAPLSDDQCKKLLDALEGSDTQKRCAIQAHTRLQLRSGARQISTLVNDTNPLVAGAARAFDARVNGHLDQLEPLVSQLKDPVPGRRRSAVIDLGDAGDVTKVVHLVSCPVSMPLRAKSAFQLVDPEKTGGVPDAYRQAITELLQDDPRNLHLQPEWICEASTLEIETNLQHRDEGKQYGGAASLLSMTKTAQLETIDHLHDRLWSDYGANYLLTSAVGLNIIEERSELVRTALAEALPQYAKSRIAAAWACLRLELSDQVDLLREIHSSTRWIPLKWSCEQVLKKLS